jgi:hypothetical protein
MAFFSRFQKLLGGGEALRPVDYLVLMAILMMIFIRFCA